MNAPSNPGPSITKPTAEAIDKFLRLTLNSSGQWAKAAIGVRGDAIAEEGKASGGLLAGRLLYYGGTHIGIASEAILVGDIVYSAASGKISKTSGGAVALGRAVTAASGDGAQFEWMPGPQT